MKNENILYSMYKPAGDNWQIENDEMIKIEITSKDDIFMLKAETKLASIVRIFTKYQMGEIFDAFMWISTFEKINYDTLINFGFKKSHLNVCNGIIYR